MNFASAGIYRQESTLSATIGGYKARSLRTPPYFMGRPEAEEREKQCNQLHHPIRIFSRAKPQKRRGFFFSVFLTNK